MNYCVLLAGGSGSRIQSSVPKQYVKVGAKMMITYSVITLVASSYIDEIYIVAEKSWHDEIMNDLSNANVDLKKIKGFARPGDNRQMSILNGMEEIMSAIRSLGNDVSSDDSVIIHDAARPYLSEELLEVCYEALNGHDGVMPVLPMKDTVYMSNDGEAISELLDRSKVFAGQAPELFRLQLYYDAVVKLLPNKILKINGASEPAIMDGLDVAMVDGDENNTKVTTDVDLEKFIAAMGCK